MEKVTSAAQALQSQADSVPGLEARITQLESDAAAADEALAAARSEVAAALQKAEADAAAAPVLASERDAEALQQVQRLTARVAELESGTAASGAQPTDVAADAASVPGVSSAADKAAPDNAGAEAAAQQDDQQVTAL